jgi:putative flippase GtrA
MGVRTQAQEPPAQVVRRSLVGRLTRYTAGSVVATVCSEVTFLLVYGVFHGGSVLASVLGWLAGAVPNYFLNRSWAWGRKGRHDLRREVLPYAAIVLVTVGVASVTTHVAGVLVPRLISTHWLQVGVVGIVFLATYGVLFAARFVLLDRVFGLARSRHQVETTTRA